MRGNQIIATFVKWRISVFTSFRLSSCFLTTALSPLVTTTSSFLRWNSPSIFKLSLCRTTSTRSPRVKATSLLFPSNSPSIWQQKQDRLRLVLMTAHGSPLKMVFHDPIYFPGHQVQDCVKYLTLKSTKKH